MYLRLVPRPKVRGFLSSHTNTPSWRGAWAQENLICFPFKKKQVTDIIFIN